MGRHVDELFRTATVERWGEMDVNSIVLLNSDCQKCIELQHDMAADGEFDRAAHAKSVVLWRFADNVWRSADVKDSVAEVLLGDQHFQFRHGPPYNEFPMMIKVRDGVVVGVETESLK